MAHPPTSSPFFGRPQQAPAAPAPAPQPGLLGRAWNGTKWAVGGSAWLASRPVAWAFAPMGDGLATGFVSGAKKEIEQLVQPDGLIGGQLKETLHQAMLRQAPPELFGLKELLGIAYTAPDTLTYSDVCAISAYLKLLSNDQRKLLKQLAPDLSPEGIQLCEYIFALVTSAKELASSPADLVRLFVTEIQKEGPKKKLGDFNTVFSLILEHNQGVLIQSLTFLREALVSEEGGVLNDAVELLKKKCTDENTGLVKKVVDQLTELLNKKDGALDALSKKLSEGEASVLGQAIALLKTKLLDKDGIVDELGKKFNQAETGIIAEALKIAKTKFDAMLNDGMDLLKKELTDEKGLLATLKLKFSGKDGILDEAIKVLNEHLFKADGGTISKLRAELNDKDRGILTEALKRLATALNDDKEGILAKGVELLRQKLTADDTGLLSDAIRLLESKLNGPGGVVEKLQHRLLNEHDGTLTKALALMQDKLNHEKSGIFAQAVDLLEKRLLAENGLVDKLGKSLNDDEKGILAQAVLKLKTAMEKKDGLLDVLDQRVQKTLTDALALLQKKCLDEKDGLIAQALAQLTEKLSAENGLLDTLSKRLNDPRDGIVAKAVATLNQKLTEENGTLSILEKKLLDEATGLFPRAIALLQKRLNDKDGVLDQAMNLLDDRLNHAERGMLVRAKNYLTDEKEGPIAKAIDLLNKKLRDEDGPINYLNFRLNDEDTGILSTAAAVLQKKLMAKGGVVDELDQRLTGQAHPLLSEARNKLSQLREAITANHTASIKKLSKSLEELLVLMEIKTADVFAKTPLDPSDRATLQTLLSRLAAFHGDTPPTQSQMLEGIRDGLAALDRYYSSNAGVAARTADVLRETITNALDPLLTRVENLPRTMVDSLLGRTPGAQAATTATTPATTNPADQGDTLSGYLAYGGSLLKTLFDKGKDAVSKQAISSTASLLSLGINYFIGKMDDSPSFQHAKTTLTGIAAGLDALARDGGNLRQLYGQFTDASRELSAIKIYANGWRLPVIGNTSTAQTNAEAIFSENMNALHDAVDASQGQADKKDWKQMAQDEQKKLVKNTADYLTIKRIYEKVCELKPPDEKFYIRMLNDAKRSGRNSDEELKKLFFEELEKKNIGFAKMAWAKVQYYFYGKIIRHYTAKASKSYFDDVFKYIDEHKVENFNTLRNQFMTNTNRYLTILGGAYKKVASNEEPTGTISEMLQTEMEKKESNLGFDTKALYLSVAQDVLKKATNSSFLSWVAKKFIGDPETHVRSLINQATGSIQDTRGYTHALNCVVREQLDEVWRILQAELAGVRSGRNPQGLSDISESQKIQLTGLLKNLLEVLRKSKCGTLQELHGLIKGNLSKEKLLGTLDDLFIEKIIEKVTAVLGATIQSLVKEDQLQKLTYKFASLANRTFEVGDEISVERMQEEESKIALRCEQILRLSINTAIEEQFDFSGKKQQTETNNIVQKLEERSRDYFASAEADLAALEAATSPTPPQDAAIRDIASPEGKTKINKVVKELGAYESECYGASFQAKSSTINSDNKDEIRARYLKIAEQSKPYVQAVVQLKQHARTLETLGEIVPHLNQIKAVLSAMGLRLFSNGPTTLEGVDFAENQLRILEVHLQDLKKMNVFSDQIESMTISVQTQTLAQILVALRKAIQTRNLGITLAQPNSLIDQIANEKKQHFGQIIPNQSHADKIATLSDQISQSVNDTLRPQLLGKLSTIKHATLPQQVDTARQEFLALLRAAAEQANTSIDQERQKHLLAFQAINQAIDRTHFLDPNKEAIAKAGLQQSIRQARQHLSTLSQWAQSNIKQVPYINLNLVDMKGLQDWGADIVYERIKDKQQGMMQFLRQPETFRYALNHLAIIPYLQSVGAIKAP